MKEKNNHYVLDSIGKVYEESEKCKLDDSIFLKIDEELSILSEYFRITKSQSFITVTVFALGLRTNRVDLDDLINHFDCNPIKILEYNDDFEYLYSSDFLIKKDLKHRTGLSDYNIEVNLKISEAILHNSPIPELNKENYNDVIQLLEKIYNLGEQRDDEEISTGELFFKTHKLLGKNLHLPLINKINNFKYHIEDTYLYLYLIWKTISGNKSSDSGRVLEGIYDNASKRITYMQKLLSGENVLIKNSLVNIVEAGFFNDSELELADSSHSLLKECGIDYFLKKKRNESLISPSDIPMRKLVFSKSEMQQLFLLKSLLKDAKFRKTQKRLTEKKLPKGVTVLLHGVSGTGKTEVVKQIAKETNRELMKVEISKSKSMWFGESEKIIKRIFTDYKSVAKECNRMPILFFNEADAIISKRKDIRDSNVAQTENAIQNIILEEMENFEGILIATTNLADHLDSAFERRFLFKIQFNKPDVSIRTRIWKSKLPFLSPKECKLLATEFDFTGGQIDNVLRKNEIHEIIHGGKVTLDNLMTFCSEETLVNDKVKIGFSVN